MSVQHGTMVSLRDSTGKTIPGMLPKVERSFPNGPPNGKWHPLLSCKTGCAFRVGCSWQPGDYSTKVCPRNGASHVTQ